MYKRQNTPPIRAASFENPHPHMRPTEIEYLTVQYSVSKNGYLFCRFEVPVKRKDHTVDLTNEWIQFYAIGGMAGKKINFSRIKNEHRLVLRFIDSCFHQNFGSVQVQIQRQRT